MILLDQVVGNKENDMKLVSVLLLVLLSGGVMAAPDNLNGKKFEQLEQMIKESKENILVLGTEADFKRFYFTEFTELLNKTKSDLKKYFS